MSDSATHHGAPRVGAGCRADLRGESQSPAETPRAGQLPVQPCMGHHAKVSRVGTRGHRHGTAESWGGKEDRKEGVKEGSEEGGGRDTRTLFLFEATEGKEEEGFCKDCSGLENKPNKTKTSRKSGVMIFLDDLNVGSIVFSSAKTTAE